MFSKLILVLIVLCTHARASNILVVCPFFGKSHSAFIQPIASALAEQGHKVTIITSNLIKDPHENIRQIQPDVTNSEFDDDSSMFFKLASVSSYIKTIFIWKMLMAKNTEYIESNSVQNFLKEPNHFDAVLVELFFQEAYYAFAHKYNAPLILLGTLTYWETSAGFMGNPPTISYLSYEFFHKHGDLDILQRTNNYALYVYHKLVYRLMCHSKQQDLIRKHFGESAPPFEELQRNVSLIFYNTHFSIDDVRPLVPGIVEVGGVHLKPPKKLPKELQTVLDEAEDGFVYFSLGSHLRSASMPKDKLEAIVKVLNEQKLKVLWKWEDDERPNVSENVIVSKWFPQSDILANPNIRLFVSQCGMLSMQEAVHRGVPVLGLPVHGDQPQNAAKMQEKGAALWVPFSDLTEDHFRQTMKEMLENRSYADMAKRVSARFNDRQNKPLETVVFWVEYVIRHRGASFMKSKLAETSWLKYNLIDVYGVLALILVAVLYVEYRVLKMICRRCTRGKKKNDGGDKKKK